MSFWTSLFGGAAAKPIEAIGNIADKLFTSDDERLSHQEVLERIRQQPMMVQAEINKMEAQHRSVFVAGWRPFIGWVCGAGLALTYVVNPCIQWYSGQPGPELPIDSMEVLVMALLGLGGLRTLEKKNGTSR